MSLNKIEGSEKLRLPPLSLYVHIPWCVRKCPYCDFNSHVTKNELPEADYLKSLSEDLSADSAYIQGRPLRSVFIGGGTPSLFSADNIARLIALLHASFVIDDSTEITLEANPGTFESEKFRGFLNAGVNRLSIGVQSFNDRFLKSLGRIHSSTEADRAIKIAYDVGFENINIDLMYGLPEQTVAEAISDLEQAFQHSPQHLSWYQLTLEPNTVFYSKPPVLPVSEKLEAIQDQGLLALSENGFSRYEVSAFAKPNQRSVHNENYWLFGDYLGIGAGAHGKITLGKDDKILRSRKIRQPDAYLKSSLSFSAERIEVSKEERSLEFLMNALRLVDGFPIPLFEQRTGLPFDTIVKQLESLQENGLISIKDGRVAASSKGYHLLDSVLQEFL